MAKYFPLENIFISVAQKHRDIVKSCLPNLTNDNLIIEPETKDTTAAILFAALNKNFKEDDILFFIPSDHHIANLNAFRKSTREALIVTMKTQQVTLFGIEPTFPAECYGYLKVNPAKDNQGFVIEKFIEKPEELKAKKLLKKKNYLWNSGMFLFPKRVLLKLAKLHAPDHFKKVANYYEAFEKNPLDAIKSFKGLKKISFDYAIMEKIKNMNCIKANFTWNDIGTWEAVYKLLKKDKNGNNFCKNVTSFASSNSLVDLENEKMNVVLNGVENLFIIQNGNNIYITTRDREKFTKKIIKKLKK